MASDDNPFDRIAALGYAPLIPIIPHDAVLSARSSLYRRLLKGKDSRGKSPGVRLLTGEWTGVDWMRLQPTPALTPVWASWKAGVGLRLDNLAALDSDTLDVDRARAVFALLQQHIPGAHRMRFGRKPKFLVLLRVPPGMEYRSVHFADGDAIELLTSGRQCVVDGIHSGTGLPYEWVGGMPARAELVEATAEQIDALFAALADLPGAGPQVRERAATARKDVDQASLRGRLDLVRSAVAALPNTTAAFPTRNSYVAVGIAIKAALPDHPDEAFDLYEDWCSRWEDPPDDAGEPAPVDDWARMHAPFEIGARFLYDKAAALGEFDKSAVFLEPVADTSAPAMSLASVSPLALIPFAEVARGALALGNLPLIKGLLDCGTASMLYAPSNAGKTFVAMDIAMHVALGLPWNGMRVRQRAVVYLAMEGGNGVRRRAEALRRRFGLDEDAHVPFYFRLVPLDLLRADGDVRPLIAAVTGIADLGLVVVDTTSRALAGGDENSSVDMGAYVRNMDAIRTATDAHVMNVHHTGKDAARGARGWSGLRAAIDTELEIEDRTFTATKQRDLEMNVSLAFTLDNVRLGTDADGDAIVSCVVRWLQPGETPAQAVEKPVGEPTLAEVPVLQAVGEAAELAPNAAYSASMDEILDRVLKSGGKMTYEGLRTHLRRLLDKGLVRRKGRGRWDVAPVRTAVAPADVFG